MSDVRGFCCLVLHTHLPYVHHPDYDDFLEEDWLFEALTETYLPLLFILEDLTRDGVPVRLGMTVTPPLAHMLATPVLVRKFETYLDKRTELAALEVAADYDDERRAKTAEHYANRFAQMRATHARWDGDILAALRSHSEAGRLELIACSATHGFLPLLANDAAVRAQVRLGADHHERVFGARPRGFWLPECAYRPGLETFLHDEGIEYTLLDTHGLTSAEPTPPGGTFRPIRMPGGVAAFGRDHECSQQVWSSQVGYPGDPDYRELYKDLGFEAEYLYIRPFLKPDGVRRNVGLKYHRITGDVELHEKELYDPEAAIERARMHAGNFLFNRSEQIKHESEQGNPAPVVVAPFDTELFGHWWYEGPHFLEALFRRAHEVGDDLPFSFASPGDVLDSEGPVPEAAPHACTWGRDGFYDVWLNDRNQWFWPHLHEMEERMNKLADEHFDTRDPGRRRLLDQMGRELLLAESSDWLFIITMETSTWYAERRFRDHVHRFFSLEKALGGAPFDQVELERIEVHDAVFEEIDFRLWATTPPRR